MSDSTPLQPPQDTSAGLEAAPEEPLDLRPWPWQPIVSGIFTVAACALIGAGIWWLLDEPDLVPVTGRITCDGKPLKDGIVTTVPVRGGMGALSPLDAAGNFKLETNG